MPWAAGVYTRGYPSWSNDAASNLPISATKFDTEDNDFAAGLNNCLTKDGLSTPSAPMTWGLSNGQVLNLTRGSDGAVLGIARTGGSNNPALQAIVADATGVGFGYSGSTYVNFLQAGGVTFSQPVAFSPGSGVAGAFAGVAGSFAATMLGSSTTGQSYGLQIEAGSNASDLALQVINRANTVNFLSLYGDGRGQLGPSAALGFAWTAAGNVTIAAPGSGATLGLGNGTQFWTNANRAGISAGVVNLIGSSGSPNAGRLSFGDGTGWNFAISRFSGGAFTDLVNFADSGAVTINAPSSGFALQVTGPAGNYAARFIGSSTSNNSDGTRTTAGTSSSDVCAYWENQAAGTQFGVIWGDGGWNVGSPTGGDQGLGSLNTQTLFVQGNPVYAGVPINQQTVSYQLVLSDANKCVMMNAVGALTTTIPANSSVAFPVGTAVTIFNDGASTNSIAITTDTLIWAANGTTGTRSLAAKGIATLLKFTSTQWVISGTGLS